MLTYPNRDSPYTHSVNNLRIFTLLATLAGMLHSRKCVNHE